MMKKISWKKALDIAGLLAMLWLFVHYVPRSIFSNAAPTGGDIGSHFWPFKLLMEQGLPEFRIKMWNPGNLMGEPILVHYFPLPYLWMTLLTPFFSTAAAFKIGNLMGAFFFPLAVYWGVRGLGLRFPAPLIAAAFSLFFSYNESFSQWGGNNVSTLSGQFAHQEALMFLFLWLGAVGWELRKKKGFTLSALMGAAVCLSHSYVFLLVPIFCLSFVFFYPHLNLKHRFLHLLTSGFFTIFLSAWFLIPMLDNNQWVTPMAIVWGVPSLFRAVLPESMRALEYFAAFAAGLGMATFALPHEKRNRFYFESLFELGFWILPFLVSVACYWIFPKIGLVDVRAIPQIQIIGFVWLGILLARGLSLWSDKVQAMGAVLFVAAGIGWCLNNTVNFPYWSDWNASGWRVKPHYNELMDLSRELEGPQDGSLQKGFSSGRVAYEHNEINGQVGTPRVFEMLPFFAHRSTLESVYLQATITASFSFYNQALISQTPSCPFRQIPCPAPNLPRAVELAPILGISDYIFVTPQLKTAATANKNLVPGGEHGPWKIYSLKDPPSLVETMTRSPKIIPYDKKWRDQFFEWFEHYTAGNQSLLVTNDPDPSLLKGHFDSEGSCKPVLHVGFNRMHLSTTCPGTVHLLKFAYHPSWQASSGDELFLVSPGYIALNPSKPEIDLEFGQRTLWTVSNFISIWAFLFLMILGFRNYRLTRRRQPSTKS